MSDQFNTRLVTGEVRFSYVNLLTPRTETGSDEPKFSTVVLLPKSDLDTKQRIDFAISQAIEEAKAGKWRGVVPQNVATPIYDGDGARQNGELFGEECRGHWVFTAKTKAEFPLAIVDLNFNPIIAPTEVYSGMYGRIAINFSGYDHAGRKGIGCYISTNVQKTRDGEPLGGSAPAAADDFSAPIGAPQPYAQQPQYQQPAPQTYGQSAQQIDYIMPTNMGAPVQPATPQQTYAPQPQGGQPTQQPAQQPYAPQPYNPGTGYNGQ